MTDQTQGIFITDGLSNSVQILDGSFPIIQGNDGNIIQLAQPIISAGNTEGLTQVFHTSTQFMDLINKWLRVPKKQDILGKIKIICYGFLLEPSQ